jgi:hypothetical protein
MTRADNDKVGQAYTRASVEAYLRAVAEERKRIESAIAEATARSEWARSEEDRLIVGGSPGPDTTDQAVDGPEYGSLIDHLRFTPNTGESTWAQPEVPTVAAHD